MSTVQEIEEVLRERPGIMALLELAKDLTPGEQYMLACFLRQEVSFEEMEAYFHEVEIMKTAQVLNTDKASWIL